MKLKIILLNSIISLTLLHASTPNPSAPGKATALSKELVAPDIHNAGIKKQQDLFEGLASPSAASQSSALTSPRIKPTIPSGKIFEQGIQNKKNEQWTKDHDKVWTAIIGAIIRPHNQARLQYALETLQMHHDKTHWHGKCGGKVTLAQMAQTTNKAYGEKFSSLNREAWDAIMETLQCDNTQIIKDEEQRIAAIAEQNTQKIHRSMATT